MKYMICPPETPAFLYGNERIRFFNNTDKSLVSRVIHAYFTEIPLGKIKACRAKTNLALYF
jgi:hypothetical protein